MGALPRGGRTRYSSSGNGCNAAWALRTFSPSRASARIATEAEGLKVALWPRLFADLRDQGVCGEDAAEHLRQLLSAPESTATVTPLLPMVDRRVGLGIVTSLRTRTGFEGLASWAGCANAGSDPCQGRNAPRGVERWEGRADDVCDQLVTTP